MLKKIRISKSVRIPLFLRKMCRCPPPLKFSIILYYKAFQIILKRVYNPNFSKQFGMSFIEIMIIALFLVGITVATAFLITRSKSSMKSVSQTRHCPMLAQEIIDQFVSFGTRLYSYGYDGSLSHQDHHPKYRPLLIMPASQNIKDIAGHSRSTTNMSKLKFPGIFAKTLKDMSMTISAGSDGHWVNTGVDIIKMQNNQLELGSSVFIINTVNVLQYLYNSDQNYFTGTRKNGTEVWGKIWSTMDSGSSLEKYKKKYAMNDLNVYLLIRPVELDAGVNNVLKTENDVKTKCQKATASGSTLTTTHYTCPKNGSHYLLLTRPRLTTDVIQKIPSHVVLHGNPDLGFELKVTIEYEKPNFSDKFYCDVNQIFTHQMDTFKRTTPPSVNSIQMTTSAGNDSLKTTHKNRANDKDRDDDVLTSCGPDPNNGNNGSHGSSYNDISLELDFGQMKTNERGTLLVCQGRTGCRSGDSQDSYNKQGISCSPQKGLWSRCHQVTFPGQTGSTQAEMKVNNQLKLTFNDLPDNRRFDLYIAEISTAGTLSQTKHISQVRFYIDSLRPLQAKGNITNDEVGLPDDNTKGRNYSGPTTDWKIPTDALSDKWLQCNQNPVDLEATIEDQFTHNLDCDFTGTRKDGDSETSITSNITPQTPTDNICKATLDSIQHGRHTITIIPKDSCEKSSSKATLVWDTDLPSTFQSKGFFDDSDEDSTDGEIWVKTTTKYLIKARVPAKTKAGSFPKHYSLDCKDTYTGTKTRDDGDGKPLECTGGATANDADGANPNDFNMKFYHVCGSSECKGTKWAVYPPVSGPCVNVRCQPNHIAAVLIQEEIVEESITKNAKKINGHVMNVSFFLVEVILGRVVLLLDFMTVLLSHYV